MFTLPVDMMPNTESKMITIFVGVRGGLPPEDIEELVTVPIEEAMATMAGLQELSSVSRKDRSTVTLNFKDDRDVKRATLEVSERLARIKGKLPREIEKPIVARYDENDHPVVILSATSTAKTPEVVRTLIERDLKPELSRLSGVANVEIFGGRQRKILVEFEKSKLEMHKIPILDVIRKIGENNLSLRSGDFDYRRDARQVQIDNSFKTLDEMKAMGIAVTKEGSRIRLGDVAVVRDYYLEPDSYARVNNQPTVSVHVQKESGANTIKVAESVLAAVAAYEKTLPGDVGLGVSIDQSVAIREAIGDVRSALLWGAFLTVLVLWLFMRHLRQVSVVVISIPVAVIGTFLAMLLHAQFTQKWGTSLPITINVMSLLGIALGIGRMVDDSIVVFENIIKRTPQRGPHNDMIKIAIDATKEMAVPVASSTLVMLVIFLPIVFISPDVRRLFADVAFTVSAALVASLLVAITVVPLLAARLASSPQMGWENKFDHWIKKWGGKLPSFSFNRFLRHGTALAIRRRGWVMLGILLSAGLSAYLYAFVLEKEFMGSSEREEFVIFVELPSGTKLDVSDKVVADIEREINTLSEIKEIVRTVSARVEGWSSKIYVKLVAPGQRTRTVQDVIEVLRPSLTKIGGEYEAFIYFSEPQKSKEIEIDVFGKDYLALRDLAVEIANKMQEIPGLVDVKLRYKRGRPQVLLNVNHAQASTFGLDSRYIADTLHADIRGLRATYFNAGKEQVETVARLSEEDRRTLDQVSNLTFVSRGKEPRLVHAGQVINFEHGYTPSEVWRKNKERVIQVSANRNKMALSTTVEKVKAGLQGLRVPIGYYYEFGGDYKKLVKTEKEFIYAFVVMVFLVYMVLACFFESYTQPFIMLLTIPLATAGSMPALWLFKTPVNMGVYIGLLMLGGTVVSNAVILIDRVNDVIDKRGLLRSVMKVSQERSRPIFMTSLTTIGAMLPLTFSKGQSSDIWAPLALTVVTGIALSAFLTLFVIPAAYVILRKTNTNR